MNNENNRSLDERTNDKRAVSRYLSDVSAYAWGSILCLYKRMNARRCKISFLCNTLWVGKNTLMPGAWYGLLSTTANLPIRLQD